MINDIISQLSNINFERSGDNLIIKKITVILPSDLKIGHVYKLKLNDRLLNPPSNSTLESNWNNGHIPKNQVYFSEINDIIGNMIKINGVAEADPKDNFFGWLPSELVDIEEELV